MGAGRRTGAVVVALALAILPGALRLVPAHGRPDRAVPMSLGQLDAFPASLRSPSDDVPIIPPDDGLSGELAPALPVATQFRSTRASHPGEVFALIVGINDYPGSRSDLGAAVADADTVDAALDGFGVPDANRVVLRDGQARREALVAAIEEMVGTAGPGTTVVFAYAGHIRKLDRDTEAIVAADGGLLRDSELAALLAPSAAERMWLLMAGCYAGGFTEALGPGRILTAAADANSLAYESPSIHGSYLVHHLVREGWLDGRAGTSVQEAFAFAEARINQEYPERRPVQFDQSGSRMRFGERPAPGAGPPAQPQSPPPDEGPPPQSPPTTEPPERRCTLLVLC